MSLVPGSRLGVYEIVGPLGAGGMGEVYRARDTTLGRDVALKILPALFADDPERLARFEREARTLAALNHPHIAQIHGIEQNAGQRALIMECVDGEDLSARLRRGPIPLEDAVPIAVQIAEALEAAHSQGVVHRDLKPANIKVRGDGVVKLLDFGLAKAWEPRSDLSTDGVENSPTITSPAMVTLHGMILGTAAYMAPEQAKGRAVDKRADVWAFGVVLFEMLAGRRPFAGGNTTEVIAQIIEREPDWNALPAATPANVRRLLLRCLQKDRKLRLRDCGDAVVELNDPVDGPAPATTPRLAAKQWVLAGLAGAMLGALAAMTTSMSGPRQDGVRPRIAQFPVLTGPRDVVITGRPTVAISGDGRHLVYVANQQLLLRSTDQLTSRPINGTGAVQLPAEPRGSTGQAGGPMVSPDGNDVAFVQGTQLKRVPLGGGTASVICSLVDFYGGSWSSSGAIFFASRRSIAGVWRVAAAGGTPEQVITFDRSQTVLRPQLLPDGDHVLFTLTVGEHWDQAAIAVQSLVTGKRRIVIDKGIDGRYLASGHLVFGRAGVLYAARFDPGALRVIGQAVPVLSGIAQLTASGASGGFDYAVSDEGTIVYVPDEAAAMRRALILVDRAGHEEVLPAEPRPYQYPRLSPDGQRVALDLRDQLNDVWQWDLSRATLTRLTINRRGGGAAVWSHDGAAVFFGPDIASTINLHRQSVSGGEPQRLSTSPNVQVAEALTHDGRWLVFREDDVNTGSDLRRLDVGSPNTSSQEIIRTQFNELNSAIAPADRWIAYQSDESGRYEVYVRPFPRVGDGRWQVSTSGGTRPLWSRDGRELFYLDQSRRMIAVPVQTGRTPTFGQSQVLFATAEYGLQGQQRNFDLAADGKRFLMVKNLPPRADIPAIVLIQNWFEELHTKTK